MHFNFDKPLWLAAAIPLSVALVAVAVWAQRKRKQALRLLAATKVETSEAPRLRWVRQVMMMGAAVLACVALARPFDGFRWEESPRTGSDLLFAVDTSKSMKASDLPPDRLTRAKLAVTDLAKQFDGERLGLVAFAGDAFVQAPLTVDRGAFLQAVDALDVDVIPRGGTDLASAIRASVQAMGSEPTRNKVLVLLSDGEDLEGGALDAAREAAKQGLTIFTLGLGSAEGELIETGSGEVVRSKLDEATLRAVAEATGGQYRALGRSGQGEEALYAAVKAKLPRASTSVERHKILDERFQIPLAIALALMLAEFLIPERRRRSARWAQAAAALVIVAMPGLSRAEAPSGVATYNEGTETYRKGDFEAAQKKFEAALRSSDVPVQVDAYYDLGNARFRLGQATVEKNRDATIAAWKQALEAYDGALALAPNDEDAKFNRDFVARKLAVLEEQKKQDEQKNGGAQQQANSGGGQQQSGQQGGAGSQQQQANNGAQQQNGAGSQQQQANNGAQQQNGQGSGGSQQQQASNGAQQQNRQSGAGSQQQQANNGAQQQNGAGSQQQQANNRAQQQNGQGGAGSQQQQASNGAQQQNGAGSQQQQASKGAQQQNDQDGAGSQQAQANNREQNGHQGSAGSQQQQANNSGVQQQSGQSGSGSQQPQNEQHGGAGLQQQLANNSGAQQPQGSAGSQQQQANAELRGEAPDARMEAGAPAGAGEVATNADAQAVAAREAQQDADARARGVLTRAEAKQLLDSVAHDLKPLPIRGRRDARAARSQLKDW